MNSLSHLAQSGFDWVLQTGWQAAVLAGLILLAQWLLRNRLSPAWRYRLWLLLVARLLMPALPQSAWSVFNVVTLAPSVVAQRIAPEEEPPRSSPVAFSRDAWMAAHSPPLLRSLRSEEWNAPAVAVHSRAATQLSPSAPEPEAGYSDGMTWWELGCWVWVLGFFVFLLRLLVSHWRFADRIAVHDGIPDSEVCRLLDECRQALGVKVSVELVETEEVDSPAVFGLWKKRLLLPDGTFQRFTREELRHIFLHELAHIRRRDLEMNWLTGLLLAAHWFNPVLWFAMSRMRYDRELATDALALSVTREQDAAGYGETLVKVLSILNGHSRAAGLVGIAESKDSIKQRLRAIARHGTGRPWPWVAGLISVALGAVALTDAIEPAIVDQRGSPPTETPAAAQPLRPSNVVATSVDDQEKRFVLQVIDFASRQPLPNVKVQLGLEYYSSNSRTQELVTLQDGIASLAFRPDDLKKLTYRTEKGGYLSLRGEWSKQQIGLLQEPVEIALGSGTEIGGVVVDQSGKPVNGVEIYFGRSMNMILSSDSRVYSQMWSVPAGQLLATTDAAGVWRARCIWPTVRWADLQVRRRGFATESYSTETTKAMEAEGKGHPVSFDDLAAKRARFVLGPGRSVLGKVINASGDAMAGIQIRYTDAPAEGPFRDPPSRTVITDQRGTFQVDDLAPGKVFFIVQTDGFAPAVADLDLDADRREIELRLDRGTKLTGLVSGPNDVPVPNAQITFQDWGIWQGVRWTTTTDENGRFVWETAPKQKFSIALQKEGFIPQRKILEAEQPVSIRLNPVLRLSGNVLDAKSRQPIKQFRITWADREEYLTYSRREAIVGRDGRYALDLGRLYADSWADNYFHRFVFQIEADGYVAATSRLFESRSGDTGEVEYDLELEPATILTGRVLDVDGQPVAGAQYAVKTPTARLRLAGKPQFEDLDKQGFPVTNARGEFQSGIDPAATDLLVVHEKGFSRVRLADLGNPGIVRLEPWAQIRGSVWFYDRPLTNEQVVLYSREESGGFVPGSIELVHMTGTSDAKGGFQFDFVPPGKVSLYRWIPKNEGASSGPPEILTIKAGDKATVKIGGKGRPLVGRFTVKNPYVPIEWQKDNHTINTVFPRPPADLKTREEHEAWRKRPEIQSVFDKLRNHPILFDEDGSFRIDEVLPGQYQFSMRILDPTDSDAFAYSKYIANFNNTFEVPDSPDRNSQTPIDLGVFELTLKPKIQSGETLAPDFTATDMAGKEFKLSDLRGKYVLLDFWATWCGPCIAEMPYLKRAYDQFKGRRDFAMLSLSLDKSVAEPRDFAQKNSMPWTQGYLGPWEKSDVPSQYGVQGIPALFLIAPDGKILAQGFDGAALSATLNKHLK